eukprot:scaffold51553_cov30-Tisochrysis_lutea.AAC.4
MARSSRAMGPRSTAKREPESLAAASISSPPSAAAASSCHVRPLGRSLSVPHSSTHTLSSSSTPSGVRSSSRLGRVAKRLSRSDSTASIFSSASAASLLALATSSLSSSAAWVSPALRSAPIFGERAFRCARAALPSSTSVARSRVSSPMRSTAAMTSSEACRRRSEWRTISGCSAMSRSSRMGGVVARAAEAKGARVRTVRTPARIATPPRHSSSANMENEAHHGRMRRPAPLAPPPPRSSAPRARPLH